VGERGNLGQRGEGGSCILLSMTVCIDLGMALMRRGDK